jgi:hypothetical protein
VIGINSILSNAFSNVYISFVLQDTTSGLELHTAGQTWRLHSVVFIGAEDYKTYVEIRVKIERVFFVYLQRLC